MRKITFGLMVCSTLIALGCDRQEAAKVDTPIANAQAASSTAAIFARGEKAPNDTFTGTVYVQPLAPKNENNNFSVASVTFEPGARAFWHSHPAGQTILVTDGRGLYQEKGSSVRQLNKGDVVLCPPDTEHWHGASGDSAMTHVVITNYEGETQVTWLRPVSVEEYAAAVK